MNNALSLYDALLAANYTLPQSLRDCYEAFREEEMQRVCTGASPEEHALLLNVLQVFLHDASANSFNQIFCLLGRDEYEKDPPGTVVELPETLLSVIGRFQHATELQGLLSQECIRFKQILERKGVSDQQVFLLGQLAAEGFSDTRNFTSVDAVIRYLAANSSPEIANYMRRAPALLANRETRSFRFPDMVAVRIDQISELGKEHQINFTLDDFRCFTDLEIKMMARDHRAFALFPNSKHYAICERCQIRVQDFAQRWMTGLEAPPVEYANLPIFRR